MNCETVLIDYSHWGWQSAPDKDVYTARAPPRGPIDLLYLGGNADLYVLYNPCNAVVEHVSAGSTHIEVIDEVSCP